LLPSFNTSGPCIPGEHYMLPPERRLGPVLQLIEERKYFTLHAGRQTGKTTSLMWLERHLNDSGRWRALWVDLETAREQPDPAAALSAILETIDRTLRLQHAELARPDANEIDAVLRKPTTALLDYLAGLSALDKRPLVLLLDEADGLVGPAMVSFLTQLRHGYIARSEAPFPASVVLVGQRQVRDYVLGAEDRRVLSWLGTTSPFNITAEATTLDPFTAAEVEELLGQHTAATGQRFEPEAARRIWELAQGHPWLTNALADQIVGRDVEDRSIPIDLMVFWHGERHAIEVKIRRDTETEAKALDQVARYVDHAGLAEGWLLLFDLRKEVSWADKLFVREVEHERKQIRIVGC